MNMKDHDVLWQHIQCGSRYLVYYCDSNQILIQLSYSLQATPSSILLSLDAYVASLDI